MNSNRLTVLSVLSAAALASLAPSTQADITATTSAQKLVAVDEAPLPGAGGTVQPDEPISHSCGSTDFDGDGEKGTDKDIEAFFAAIAGVTSPLWESADFDGDGDVGTDADIEAFFRVLSGKPC